MALTNNDIIARIQAIVRDTTTYTSSVVLAFVNRSLRKAAGSVLMPELASSDTVQTQVIDIASITAATPMVVNTTAVHGLTSGDLVILSGCDAVPTLNGSHIITVTDTDTFTLDGSTSTAVDAAEDYGDALVAYVSLPSDYHRELQHCYSQNQEWSIKVHSPNQWAEFLRVYPELDECGSVESVCVRGKRLYYQPVPSAVETLRIYYYRLPTDSAADTNYPDGIPEQFADNFLIYDASAEILLERGMTEKAGHYAGLAGAEMDKIRQFYGPDDVPPEYTPDDGFYTSF